MYVVYMPKYQGDVPDYNIIRVISGYMGATAYDCEILCAPGYMNLNKNTTDNFYNKLVPILKNSCVSRKRKIEVGIFNGMNGTRSASYGITCRQQHENSIVSHGLKLIYLKCKNKKEHQKMIFFMEKQSPFNGPITIKNYMEFLNTVVVKAVMIGSSNQNLTTYYGGFKGYSDKGEADVFMFVDIKNVADAIISIDPEGRNIVVSESLNLKNKSDERYLRGILENFLKNSLTL